MGIDEIITEEEILKSIINSLMLSKREAEEIQIKELKANKTRTEIGEVDQMTRRNGIKIAGIHCRVKERVEKYLEYGYIRRNCERVKKKKK